MGTAASQPARSAAGSAAPSVAIRALAETDLPEAERIFRLAFGTFLGAPEPETFWSDRDYVRGRWHAPHVAAFAAEVGGELVGSNFATRWGSLGFFGPLTIRPDLWDRGIGARLVEAATARFDEWGTRHAGLFTFAQSAKHVGLYQKYGYWARFLTAIMSAPVRHNQTEPVRWSRYSDLTEEQGVACLKSCRDLTGALYEGLDLGAEIRAVQAQGLGETVLLGDMAGAGLDGFAVCHHGPRSEAGDGACFIKFGAVRPGSAAGETFDSLLHACEALAATVGMPKLLAGVNMARHEAYRHLVGRGFRTEIQGVTMHRPNEPGYSRAGVFVLDDWR
jgi:GNAT superfamily N-acetyltransferase